MCAAKGTPTDGALALTEAWQAWQIGASQFQGSHGRLSSARPLSPRTAERGYVWVEPEVSVAVTSGPFYMQKWLRCRAFSRRPCLTSVSGCRPCSVTEVLLVVIVTLGAVGSMGRAVKVYCSG